MLDRANVVCFCCICREPNAGRRSFKALVGWRMVDSIMQVLAAEGSTNEEVLSKATHGGKVCQQTDLLPSVQAIYDGHSHLDS